ncbi:MAG TPA: 50S ribosomal protein L10 [Candidatus Saccharimonadales bacterium]|nr:50S ribosomal protein L10 [Candidatus Saccharimonadales bacterium]
MALSKDKKQQVVKEVSDRLVNSKLTVVAAYQGTPVKALQTLRRQARDNGTRVQVIKNRLVIKALQSDDKLKGIDTSSLTGMLMYASNAEDEVAPAQTLANFAKTQPTIEFVGAITPDGQFIGAEDVKALAALPSKEQLRGMLVGTIAAPLSGFVNVLAGNVRGVLNVLNARAQAIGD